jgi:transposase
MIKIIRYSESFKLQVVREVEEGMHESCYQAAQTYGIGGGNTVQNWVCKYGMNHLLNKVVKVEKPNERNELKELKAKIRKLESALSAAHLDLIIEKEYIKMACEAAGIDDVEEFKKKHGTH